MTAARIPAELAKNVLVMYAPYVQWARTLLQEPRLALAVQLKARLLWGQRVATVTRATTRVLRRC